MNASASTLLATWFNIGRLRPAPGTLGSLAALPMAFAVHYYQGSMALLALGFTLFFIGIWACNGYLHENPEKQDPGEVVIDEVAAQCLILTVMPPNLVGYAVGFTLFRLLDIVKPWPISWADEKISGGIGIMMDDLIAAVIGCVAISAIMGAMP